MRYVRCLALLLIVHACMAEDWCATKPTKLSHTIAGGTTCIVDTQIQVEVGTELIISHADGDFASSNSAEAILTTTSGEDSNADGLFLVRGKLTLRNLVIQDVVTNNAAIYVPALDGKLLTSLTQQPEVTLVNMKLRRNRRSPTKESTSPCGGAMEVSNAKVLLSDTTFDSNIAYHGGALCATSLSTISLSGKVDFKSNVASDLEDNARAGAVAVTELTYYELQKDAVDEQANAKYVQWLDGTSEGRGFFF